MLIVPLLLPWCAVLVAAVRPSARAAVMAACALSALADGALALRAARGLEPLLDLRWVPALGLDVVMRPGVAALVLAAIAAAAAAVAIGGARTPRHTLATAVLAAVLHAAAWADNALLLAVIVMAAAFAAEPALDEPPAAAERATHARLAAGIALLGAALIVGDASGEYRLGPVDGPLAPLAGALALIAVALPLGAWPWSAVAASGLEAAARSTLRALLLGVVLLHVGPLLAAQWPWAAVVAAVLLGPAVLALAGRLDGDGPSTAERRR